MVSCGSVAKKLGKGFAIAVAVGALFTLGTTGLAPNPDAKALTEVVVMEDLNSTTGMSLYSERKAHVQYVTSDSQMLGEEIDSILLKLKRIGNPSGTAEVGVFDSSLALKKSFGKISAASVSTSYTDYNFTLADRENDGYTLQAGDGVGIFYDGGDGSSNMLSVMRDITGQYDGASTYHRYYYADDWTDQFTNDLYMRLLSTSSDDNNPPPESAPKYVMIHFDDGRKSPYDYARPILNKYDIKASFWIVCSYASGTDPGFMRWSEIDTLVKEGHDIQNHGMNHVHLPTLTDSELDANIGDCKNEIMQHGSSGDAFAIPFNDGDDNERVINAIARHHNYGKGDGGAPQPASCGAGGCEIYKTDGSFNPDSRYAIKQWSHDTYSNGKTEAQILQGFRDAVDLGTVDSNGDIVTITAIVYHKVNEGGVSPSTSLLDAEMKYLHDNGFTTLGMDDITYNEAAGRFELRH